ncbi:PucR family transcriptional regulator [Pseudonocardia acidicola]|uniref:PucR family transcriptional regulator n=1 Tax=Pseudonocardia acidicola TaxID=2724939 RepID=A0ABX1SM87_9PSEU|nr:PucR family transcriptional regulator [Pseudonocardia acidicola]NMI01390.1 PucR family transcriptional regulator [Pseudonocardia acidicola]
MDRPWTRVPGWVGAALRPDLVGATDEIIAAVRAQVPEYARPLEGRFGQRITEGVSVALEQFAALLGSDDELCDTRIYHNLGQVEHREGRTLAALQTAYQVGTRTVWQHIAACHTAGGLPPEVIFALAEALFGYIEQLSAASVAGWAHAEATRAGSVRARRHALVEVLARRPPAGPTEVERAAAAAGWTLPARLVALAVPDAVEISGRLPDAVAADLDPVGIVLLPVPERAGWIDRLRAALRDRRGVLGPVVCWAHAYRSVARARAAWPLHAAGALGVPDSDPLVRADDHLVTLLLAAEPELAADLHERAVAPLAELPAGAAARAEETLRAWLDAHGDVSATAAALHVHPQTVRYRLAGLREAFGGALDDPTARLELALALRVRPAPADSGAAEPPPRP